MEGSETIKFMSLNLERLKCESLDMKKLEHKYQDILPSLTRREFDEYLMSEQIEEVFGMFS